MKNETRPRQIGSHRLQSRREKLRALADPARNPNEHERLVAANELARLARLDLSDIPRRAWVHTEGPWLLAAVPLVYFEEAKGIALEAMGHVSRIDDALAWYDTDDDSRRALVNALRYHGYDVVDDRGIGPKWLVTR